MNIKRFFKIKVTEAMASYVEMEVQEPWFGYLVSGQKKVEGRKNSPKWRDLKPSEKVLLTCGKKSQLFLITDVRKYSSIRAYLEQEGLRNCLPGVESIEEGIAVYKQWNTDEELELHRFFLAIEMKPIEA